MYLFWIELDIVFFLGTRKVNLYRDFLLIGNGTLCGNLYRLELYSLLSFCLTVNTVRSTKHFRLMKSFLFFGTSVGTPQHNGIAERRNCTLLDMV